MKESAPRDALYSPDQVLALLDGHFSTFRSLVEQARALFRENKSNSAAAFAQIAADYAWKNPPGQLASPELEQMLRDLGRKFLPARSTTSQSTSRSTPKRILHVLTTAYPLGGHTRFVWRWIRQDSGRAHSIVLTGQRGAKVPTQLEQAVKTAGGGIHFLDERFGRLFQRAEILRQLSRQSDLVILHVHPYDVLPILAFSEEHRVTPTVYVNHADHVFSIGVATSDIVANIRTSGYVTSFKRRGIQKDRGTVLPIPLGEILRTQSRADAKRILGVPESCVVLLSIASASKYRPISEISFCSAVLPVLERCEQACLMLVGPECDDQWREAVARFPDRIKIMGRQENTATFYEAADIYVDSFPFASLTSLLEAGSYGLPLVTFFPYSNSASVLGADDIALENCMVRATTLEEYRNKLCELVEDPNRRMSLGERTQTYVTASHRGEGWMRHLEHLYNQALRTKPVSGCALDESLDAADELDEWLVRLHQNGGISCSLQEIFKSHLGLLPLGMRLRKWVKLRSLNPKALAAALAPDWVYARVRRWVWS